MTITMNVTLLMFRRVIGLTLAGHGAQKLFGWFGGTGPVREHHKFAPLDDWLIFL